ncbi:hypothetical protein Plhal304r1_c062g0150101 [Plasmopara halstedii]
MIAQTVPNHAERPYTCVPSQGLLHEAKEGSALGIPLLTWPALLTAGARRLCHFKRFNLVIRDRWFFLPRLCIRRRCCNLLGLENRKVQLLLLHEIIIA